MAKVQIFSFTAKNEANGTPKSPKKNTLKATYGLAVWRIMRNFGKINNDTARHRTMSIFQDKAKDNSDDAQLIMELRSPQTCRAAFGRVIAMYTEPLYRQIRRMVQSHDDANDLLQNSFIKAWSSLENFRGDARLSTWLYKIAINESLTFLERERRRLNISLDDQQAMLVNTIEGDPFFDGDRAQRLLREAVATLPEKQRLVFNMKYFDEMKYEDMSAILGTSVGALKTSYHFAVKKIENFIEKNQ